MYGDFFRNLEEFHCTTADDYSWTRQCFKQFAGWQVSPVKASKPPQSFIFHKMKTIRYSEFMLGPDSFRCSLRFHSTAQHSTAQQQSSTSIELTAWTVNNEESLLMHIADNWITHQRSYCQSARERSPFGESRDGNYDCRNWRSERPEQEIGRASCRERVSPYV